MCAVGGRRRCFGLWGSVTLIAVLSVASICVNTVYCFVCLLLLNFRPKEEVIDVNNLQEQLAVLHGEKQVSGIHIRINDAILVMKLSRSSMLPRAA